MSSIPKSVRQYVQQNFGIEPIRWMGIVEDRNDPMQLGRVRVRVHGYHTDDKSLIPTDKLPWAQVLMPPTSAAVSGVGQSPTGIMEGSLVVGFWLDGRDMQMPCVEGTLNTHEGMGPKGLMPSGSNQVNDVGGAANVPGYDNPTGDGPPWLKIARGELGVKRFAGPQHNPRILEYLKVVGLAQDERISWCSAFAAWSVKKGGGSIAGVTGMAKSWVGAADRLDKPLYGCITVFNRPPKPQQGHVAFYVGTEGGRLKVLGGNQGSAVSIAGYGTTQLVGYFWPKGAPRDENRSGSVNNAVTTTSQDQA